MTTQQNVLTQNEILLHIIIYRKSAGLLKQTSTYKEHPKTTKKKPKKHLQAGYPINNSNNAPIIII